MIGSARCKEFRTVEGRKQAALNLVANGINHLVVIGGDGSLTGANLMRTEWVGLLKELIADGKVCEREGKWGGGRRGKGAREKLLMPLSAVW